MDRPSAFNIYVLPIAIAILLASNLQGIAQLTKVRGSVTDAETEEPLPFVNLQLKGTSIGTITDMEGNFFLQARTQVDTLVVSFMGYRAQEIKLMRSQYQEINIKLKPADNVLNEIVVKAGENPSWPIMRNIMDNKKANDIDRIENFEYEVYNKMEIDINNFDDSDLKKRKLFKNFQFVLDYVDTSVETGKTYLPVFISETVSDYYYQRSPKREKEIVKASRVSGMKNDAIAQYTGQMYVNVNMYDNFVDVFGKPFVSPLNGAWKLYYKYYLVDSSYIDGHHCYLISFKPKRKQESTFTGEFWVADTTWAIKKVKARVSKGANLNYVKDFIVQAEFEQVDNKYWFMAKEELFVDFNVAKKTAGFFGRKTATRKNIKINKRYHKDFFSRTEPQESVVEYGATEKDTAYWNQARHEKLSKKEQDIYNMVDSVKNVPLFRNITDIMGMLTIGYYDAGWWEYGPYFKTFSSNPIEGSRFRIGARTSEEFSAKIQLEGHVAYGLGDERFKYGASALFVASEKPRRHILVKHQEDIEQLGLSVNAFQEDNILSTMLSRTPNDKLQLVNSTQTEYHHEWFQGFSNSVSFLHRIIYPTDVIPFERSALDKSWQQLTTSDITLTTRFAYNEKFIGGRFNRFSLGSEYPIVRLDLTAGLKNILGSDYEYYRISLDVSHHLNIPPIGRLQYSLQGGKIIGDVPFPLLKLHEGNGTYAFDRYAFNMMNYYEFASDTYFSFYAEHHFNGFFLNKFPLIRKLKMREIIYAKGLIGSISEGNSRENAIFDFPETLGDVNKPYFEAGVGLENIFRVLRLDAIWRLSYLDDKDTPKFGLRASIQIIL